MEAFLWIIALAWMLIGLLLLITPRYAKKILRYFAKAPKLCIGLLPVVIGILLLIAAPISNWYWYIAILGMMGIIKGLFFIITSKRFLKTTIDWWANQSLSLYRFWGIVVFVMGLLTALSMVGQ